MLKVLSMLGYLGMVGGIIAQLATGNLISSSAWAIAAQSGAILLFVWARLTFGRRSYHVVANPTEGGLVTSGPYRHIRHPIYTAMVVFSGAAVAANWSGANALLGGLVAICALMRITCEEILVTARYPEYRQYAARTWRMIPYLY